MSSRKWDNFYYRNNTPIITNAELPFVYNNRFYIFVTDAYHKGRHLEEQTENMCSLPLGQLIAISETEDAFSYLATVNGSTLAANLSGDNEWFLKLQYENGTRPTELVWRCADSEKCCSTECCTEPSSPWYVIAISFIFFSCIGTCLGGCCECFCGGLCGCCRGGFMLCYYSISRCFVSLDQSNENESNEPLNPPAYDSIPQTFISTPPIDNKMNSDVTDDIKKPNVELTKICIE
ncbi:hypothetical protein M3Y94_01034700 [Aphelenchoides besseyi]|nr:hypothetical protein M3Y94_01034700 [Aphelenchoides besseyi]